MTKPYWTRPTAADLALVALANDLRATHGAALVEHTRAGYGLRDALRLALADDDDRIDAFGAEADRADDAFAHCRAMDAVHEQHGQGPAGARWDIAGLMIEALLTAAA